MGDSGGDFTARVALGGGISSVDSHCAKKSCKSCKDRDPLGTQAVKRTGRDGYHAVLCLLIRG